MTNPKIETLQDRFIDGTLDTSFWEDSADLGSTSFWQTPSFAYGQMTCPGESGAGVYSGICSLGAYDLTQSGLSVELFSLDSAASAAFTVQDGSGNYVQLYINPTGPELEFNLGATTVVSAAYSAVDHRFLRVCETGGVLYADTSADGVEWMTLGSVAVGSLDATSVKVQLSVGENPASSVAAQWGNIGLVPASSRLVEQGFVAR